MRAFLQQQQVSKSFWPERLEILEQLPRNPTGKVLKFVLRQMAQKLAGAAQPDTTGGAASS